MEDMETIRPGENVIVMSHAGYQHYTCGGCGFEWTQLCRDVGSDSGENCLLCHEHTRPDDQGEIKGFDIEVFDAICGSHRWVRANNGDEIVKELDMGEVG